MYYKNKELAEMIARFSLNIKKGDKVFIKYKSEESLYLVEQLSLEISKRGGVAFPYKFNKRLEDVLQSTYDMNSIEPNLEKIKHDNQFYDVFVSIGSNDRFEFVKKENKEILDEFKRRKMQLEYLKQHKRWLLLNYPSIIDSTNMEMSYDEYYKYAFDAMTFDFSPILDSIEELKTLIEQTEHIKIIGDNVHLEFDKNGIPAVPLIGNKNLPDGEIYTSPIKDSTFGRIKYNVPSPKNGIIFNDILLQFNKGKVVNYNCSENIEELGRILSIDDGAKYIGEFAFGFNPVITKPMNDILYDEKLRKSFHIALGNCYPDAYNGNHSALHWDMIYLNEDSNYCDVYFDGKLIYSKGLFLPKKIRRLNFDDW